MEFSFGTLAGLQDRGRVLGRTLAEPTVVERDRQASWHPALFRALAGSGLTGLLVPTGYGGLGLSVLEAVALLEGFGEGSTDAGLALAVGAHGVLCGAPIAALGTAAQRDRYLPGIATGERLGALALSELDGGATAGGTGGTGGTGVAAEGAGAGWRLSGHLRRVLNGVHADHFLLTAGTAAGGRIAFLLDRGTPGLAVVPQRESGVLRTATFAELTLAGCPVGADAVLGTPGAAGRELVPLLAALDRTCLLAPWLGIVRAVAAHTLAVAAEQPLLGGPLARSQVVRMAVVDLLTRVELAAGLLYRAGWQLGRLERAPRLATATAKLFLVGTVRDALRTAAGFAGITPHPVLERTCRDAFALAPDGGEEVLRSVVAGALLDSAGPDSHPGSA